MDYLFVHFGRTNLTNYFQSDIRMFVQSEQCVRLIWGEKGERMSTVTPTELLKLWTLENMQPEMAVGHILQNLVKLQTMVIDLRIDVDRLIALTKLPPRHGISVLSYLHFIFSASFWRCFKVQLGVCPGNLLLLRVWRGSRRPLGVNCTLLG